MMQAIKLLFNSQCLVNRGSWVSPKEILMWKRKPPYVSQQEIQNFNFLWEVS